MRYKYLSIVVMVLLVIPIASSLGVTPGRTTLNFEPNLEREVRFKVWNNENRDLRLALYARGGLSEYIELSEEEIELSEESVELSYTLRLPDELEEPGLYGGEIVIREVTIDGQEKDISIGAMQAVITQAYVNVPYPGKYIIARLDIVGGDLDKETLFFVPLINLGDEDVESAKAEIIIMDMYGKVIEKADTNEIGVPAKGRAELSAQIDPSSLTPGIDRVVAKVTYDGFVTTAENTLYVSDFFLIPLDISVRDFTLGDIAKFNILVENIGNVDVMDAYSLILLDKKGENVANLKSVGVDFKPFEKKEMLSYWDTENVKADRYDGKLVLGYDDKTKERGIRTVVGQNSIDTEIIGITGYVVKESGSPIGGSPLIVLVIILVMANFGWFIYYFRSRIKR